MLTGYSFMPMYVDDGLYWFIVDVKDKEEFDEMRKFPTSWPIGSQLDKRWSYLCNKFEKQQISGSPEDWTFRSAVNPIEFINPDGNIGTLPQG